MKTRGSSGDPLWIPRGSSGKMGDPGVFHYEKLGDPLRPLAPFIILKGKRGEGVAKGGSCVPMVGLMRAVCSRILPPAFRSSFCALWVEIFFSKSHIPLSKTPTEMKATYLTDCSVSLCVLAVRNYFRILF